LKILQPLCHITCFHMCQHNRVNIFAQWGSYPKF
jgi:hypothetical protein